jgi:hypothetical protein
LDFPRASSEGAEKGKVFWKMTVELEYNPERTKELRKKGADLSELQSASEQALTEAMREGDLDKARSVLEQASLAVREYEDFRKAFTPKEILLAKYGVEVINDHTVMFVIPKGVSRMEILEEVQGLIKHPNGKPFIYPPLLSEWKGEERFASQQATSKRLCIDGHVQGGDGKTREQQEAFLSPDNQNGGEQFQMANIEDLAVAFCLHWVATGEPLIGWYNKQVGYSYYSRAVGDALCFYVNGLGLVRSTTAMATTLLSVFLRAFPRNEEFGSWVLSDWCA